MAEMLARQSSAAGRNAALFQALVENSSDAIVLLDSRGMIRYASRSLERVFGYPPEERLGRSALEFIHEDDLPRVAEAFARGSAQPGVPQTFEFRLHHKDGSWRHVEATAVNRLGEPAVQGIVVNYRDVSKRQHAVSALRASEERLRHLFETAPDIIYYCSASGRFTYVNPTACRVMKYAEGELIGRHFMTLIHPDYAQAARTLYAQQLAERIPNTYFEFPALVKDGSTVWVGQHVQLVVQDDEVAGVQAICRDISKQKDAEERLRRSEARNRSLIHGAAFGIYRATMEGEILDANPAFAVMLGYRSVEEVRAVTMRDIYLPTADRAGPVARFNGTSTDARSEEVHWRKRGGTVIVVRLTAHVVDFDGTGECVEGIVEDITETRALEDQLRQSQKMEAVGRLARGIAHDFNNVLAAILGNADLLQLRLKEDDPMYADVVEISKAAERGASLTRQLLAFSRRQSMEPEILDLHEVVRGFDSMLRRLSGDLQMGLHTPGPAPLVRIEPGQIEQVVMNLVVNARDAVSEGGTIDVLADIVSVDGQTSARYAGVTPGAYARIAVEDTGAGIQPEIGRHVFEPFFTTKDPARGTGLGLSIVYGIAKHAGGAVRFSSTPGVGTMFEVLLPIARRV